MTFVTRYYFAGVCRPHKKVVNKCGTFTRTSSMYACMMYCNVYCWMPRVTKIRQSARLAIMWSFDCNRVAELLALEHLL